MIGDVPIIKKGQRNITHERTQIKCKYISLGGAYFASWNIMKYCHLA